MEGQRWKQTAAQIKTALLQDKKRLWLLLGAAAMLVLLLLTGGEKQSRAAPSAPSDRSDWQTTQDALCELLGAIRGVGRVQVMLRFASRGETVYAVNADSTRDEGAGDRQKRSVVLVKDGQRESGLVVREETPQVTGAAVVCDGGGDPVVRAFVVETLSALLGIKSNHISVMPM